MFFWKKQVLSTLHFVCMCNELGEKSPAAGVNLI